MPMNPDVRNGLAVGTNVAILLPGDKTKKFFRITNRDTIFYRDAHASLATGVTEAFAEITNLNPPPGQLYQIHGIVMDGNTELSLKQPAATNRWGTSRSPAGGLLLDKYSFNGAPELVNLWFIEDYPPNTQLVNNTPVSIVTTLWWVGWRYQIEKLSEPTDAYVEVSIGPPGQ